MNAYHLYVLGFVLLVLTTGICAAHGYAWATLGTATLTALAWQGRKYASPRS